MSVHLETPILLIVVVIGLFCLWEVHCFQSKRYFTTHTVLDPLRRSRDHEGAPYSRGKFLDVWYTNDPATIDKWLKDNIPSSGHVTLGLDVETAVSLPWRKARLEGPSTVQLATPDSCLVVHLFRHDGKNSEAMIPMLEAIFADDAIIKAGVGIDNDLLDFYSRFGIEARSRLDLGGVGVQPNAVRGETTGIKRLAKAVLGLDFNKKLSLNDWSQIPLSKRQLSYCARDAWVGAAVVDVLCSRDPKTFHPEALRTMLAQHEFSLEILQQRRDMRRNARQHLSSLSEHQKAMLRTENSAPEEKLKLVDEEMKVLRDLIYRTRPEYPRRFDLTKM